jgi:hypothetical protein
VRNIIVEGLGTATIIKFATSTGVIELALLAAQVKGGN